MAAGRGSSRHDAAENDDFILNELGNTSFDFCIVWTKIRRKVALENSCYEEQRHS